MKVFLATFLIPLLPHLAAIADAAAPAERRAKCKMVITTDGKTMQVVSEDGKPCDLGALPAGATAEVTVVMTGDADETGGHVVLRRLGAPNIGGAVVISGDEEDGRGYLGVSIGEVSDVLASQFDVGSRGVLVLNVVDDSPADEGGIERHDIIMSLDGKTVDHEIDSLVKMIRSHEPGDDVTVGVLRGGKELLVVVTLGARQGIARNLEWKFEFDPDAQIEERIETRGHMLMKDGEGKWTIKNLGEIDEEFLHLLPDTGTFMTKVYVDGDTKTVERHAELEGITIIVKQDDDGEVTVERIEDDGTRFVKVYVDESALEADDEEASKLFSHGDPHGCLGLKIDVLGDVDLSDLSEHLAELKIELHTELAGVGEHVRDALKNLDHVKELNIPNMGSLRWFAGDGDHAPGHWGKPKHTFHANEDGSIEVRIRKGDAELVRHYANAADLAHRAPKLSEQYEDLMELGEED